MTCDLADVRAMVRAGLFEPARAIELLGAIEPELERFAAVDPGTLRREVTEVFAPDSPAPRNPTSTEPTP